MNINMPTSLAGERYQLGQLVGRGGMAEVHVALDTRLGRTVAVKIMRADFANDKIFLERFRREAHSVAQMNNPNIVNIYDSGEEVVATETGQTEHLPYLVMEYVKGQTLRDILKVNGALSQRDATELSHADHLLFGCGRYEGYDARIPDYYRAQGVDVREYSIGDYVLNGGEVAVSVMLEAITRLMPGFMGNPDSIVEESYTGEGALLEHRQYTKPAVWRGIAVPDVLLSGDHGKVDRFRRDEALARTAEIRPDLITAYREAFQKANVLENAYWKN